MVDFTRETLVDVRQVCERMRVTHDTVYRWFRKGLEFAKVGGKVITSMEAISRFSRQSESLGSPALVEREAVSVIRELKERFGIIVGQEPRKNGRKQTASGQVSNQGMQEPVAVPRVVQPMPS
jgi:transcription initiation factor TFIIIB Brf1 subunit/transcription initiation factor TFIIB